MRGNVTFQCKLPIDLNKHPPGEELAEYLAVKMTDAGMRIHVADNYDDFAWLLECQSARPRPWILLGYVGDGVFEWLVQINSGVGWLGRLLGRSDAEDRQVITTCLQEVLSADDNFFDIRWHVGYFGDQGWSASPE